MAPLNMDYQSPVTTTLVAEGDQSAIRLDRFLAERVAGLSRSRAALLVKTAQVLVDGQPVIDVGSKVRAGQIVSVTIPPAAPAAPAAQAIPLTVIYEDADLIVIDKPAGLVVHPAAGHAEGTLVNALLAHCAGSLSGIGGVKRPGIVHRLDKDTSGLLVVAKTDAAHQGLSAQFAAHGIDGRLTRTYLALCWGKPERSRGRIEARIGRSATNRTRMAVLSGAFGRHAVTHYAVEQSFSNPEGSPTAALLRVNLETGRTHQVRVHLAHIGHPLLGDPLYGAGFRSRQSRLAPLAQAALQALNRQALHAAELGFHHPVTGRELHFASAIPPDLAALIAALSPVDVPPSGPAKTRQRKPKKATDSTRS